MNTLNENIHSNKEATKSLSSIMEFQTGTAIIDTHVHIWKPRNGMYGWLQGADPLLQKDYEIGQLEDERSEAGITAGVLVQADNNFDDTDGMLQVAETTGWIKGVVGWLPLMNPVDTLKALEEKYRGNPYFKGVRHLIHDEADPRWLLQGEVIESLQILADKSIPFDVVAVLPAHIETALEVAAKVPQLKMVFDHLSQPPISTKEKFGIWGDLMSEAAKHKNFFAKISGLGTASKNFTSWTANDILPYIEFCLEHFGTDRCFCGGDWPVSLLAGSYIDTWKKYKEALRSLLKADELEKVLSKNAERFYNL